MAAPADKSGDLYEVLQVHPKASAAMIRKAYGWLAQQYHPDKNPEKKDWAETQMKALNAAFETLSDPTKRRAYNASYPGVRLNGTASGHTSPDLSYADDPPGSPTRGRSSSEREARKSRYYPTADEAYATSDAPPGTASYEQRRAQDYVERKRYDRAIRHYRRAIQIEPDNAGLLVELAMAYYLHLDLQSARQHLERALEKDPSLADAHYMLGMIALDDAVLQAVERDASGRPAYIGRSQRRYFTLFSRAVEHFEKALFLRPELFRKQFTFFPLRKSVAEYAATDTGRVRSLYDFSRDARTVPTLKSALLEWYFDHAQNAFADGMGGDGEFLANLKRLLPRQGVKMFLSSWAYAALKSGLELYPEDLTLLKAYEKLLSQGQFLGEQPMSRDLASELKRAKNETFLKIKLKDQSFKGSESEGVNTERVMAVVMGIGIAAIVFMIWKVTEFLTSLN